MATFSQNRPPVFSPYIPELSSEVLGKAFAIKDQEYKQGLQKVDAYLDNIAGLPVANPAQRDYLQGKINTITSDLNEKVGTDFSNNNQVNTITGHIASLTQDPTVQKAISSASTAKRIFSDMQEDDKTSKGANVANKYAAMEVYHKFYNSADPNEELDAKYIKYNDVNKWGDDVMSKIKPQWRKIDSPTQDYKDPKTGQIIHAYRQYNKSTEAWEEIPEQQIRQVLEEGIKNDPEIATQMSINAKYLMKDLSQEDYIGHKIEQIKGEVTLNNKGIQNLRDISNGIQPIPDDVLKRFSEEEGIGPELIKQKLSSKADELEKYTDSLKKYDFKQDLEDWENPERNQEIKNQLYKASWIQQKVDQYGGKTKYEYTLEGDPVARELAQSQFQWQMKKDIWDKQDKDYIRGFEDKKEKERIREWKLEHPGLNPTFSQLPTNVGSMSNPWGALKDQRDKIQSQVTSETNQYIYNSLPQKDKDRLFVKSVDENSNPILRIKPGTKDKDGNDLNVKEVNDLFDKYSKTRQIGNITLSDPDGAKIPLTTAKIAAINKIRMDRTSLKNYDESIDEGNNLLEKSGIDIVGPALKDIDNVIKVFNKTYGTNYNTSMVYQFVQDLGNDPKLKEALLSYQNSPSSKINALTENLGTVFDASEFSSPSMREIVKKYGKDLIDNYGILFEVPEINKIVNPSQEYLEQRANLLNNYARQSQLVPISQTRAATTGDAKADLQVKHDFRDVLTKIPGGLNDYPIAQTALTKDNSNVTIDTYWDNGQLYALVTDLDNKKGTPESIPIPAALVSSLGNYVSPDDSHKNFNSITQTLMSSNHSNYTDNNPNWNESYPIEKNKTGLETRVGFEWSSIDNQWYRHMYIGHTIKDAHPIDDGVPVGSNADEIGKWVEQQMITNNTISENK